MSDEFWERANSCAFWFCLLFFGMALVLMGLFVIGEALM